MRKITFDFENETVTEQIGANENTLIVPGLKNREDDILGAAGLVRESLDSIRNDIDDFFAQIGADVRCAEPDKPDI